MHIEQIVTQIASKFPYQNPTPVFNSQQKNMNQQIQE